MWSEPILWCPRCDTKNKKPGFVYCVNCGRPFSEKELKEGKAEKKEKTEPKGK